MEPHLHTPHQEPEEIFLPLSQHRYAEFYSIEMDGFEKDIDFYQNHIPAKGSVLELGCGTGRICHALSSLYSMVGIDLSLDMLQQARRKDGDGANYVCMDMTRMVFKKTFDRILIPYNTLNLLQSEALIGACLHRCHDLLQPDGKLLLQLYIPQENMLQDKADKVFQFQIFPLPHEKGKLIKESIRSYSLGTKTLHLEERYRVRPTGTGALKEDFSHVLHLAALSTEQWLTLFNNSGFRVNALYGSYDNQPFQAAQDSLLLLKASLC